MALSLQLGFPNVPKSVTNPNVDKNDALDVSDPMPFLTFIKLINVSFEPDSLQSYYNYYLKTWNNLNIGQSASNEILITNTYRDFIKDVSLNYTTPEEKIFLAKIDFNDPYDLDVVIGFYSKKLKELSRFYNDKRHNVKFNLNRSKLNGTNFGTEKTLKELTLSHLKNLEDSNTLYDYQDIRQNVEIELEELYDSYPKYFNQTPDPLVYDYKDLDYGYNIFLIDNATLISTVLSGFSTELAELKELDQVLDNKRKLTAKYMATDFYYLSTGATVYDVVSGKLLDNDNNVVNFLNRNYPTTASTQRTDYLDSPRIQGFFKPTNQTIILVDGENYSYNINYNGLTPNTLYYFGDPNIFGENGGVLSFIVDDSKLKKNYSAGMAVNQPYSKADDTKYYGYVSKIERGDSKYLENIFDIGTIKDSKRDIYNNLFGLVKDDPKFRKNIQTVSDSDVQVNMLINGYQFYDELFGEGYSFDYSSTVSPFTETIRTGLTANTGYFTTSVPDINLFFGYFTPYNELIKPTETNILPSYEIIEGAFITKSDSSFYPDPVKSDLSAFEVSSESFYFTDLVEGGIRSISPLQRALKDPLYPTLSANATLSLKTSAINIVDGGDIMDAIYPSDSGTNKFIYDDTLNVGTTYSLSTFPIDDNYNYNGTIFIKNSQTKVTGTLLDQIPYIENKYLPEIVDELDGHVVSFDMVMDTLIIETINYLAINKLNYSGGEFIDPKTNSFYIQHSETPYNKISNRFKKDYDVFYCKMNTLQTNITSNEFMLYPEIYKLDTLNFKHTLIFPQELSQITDFFKISGGDIRYTTVDTPHLTYNSRNNLFNISFLLKDQNGLPSLHNMDLEIGSDVLFIDHKSNVINVDNYSTILSSTSELNVFFIDGAGVTFTGEELTI